MDQLSKSPVIAIHTVYFSWLVDVGFKTSELTGTYPSARNQVHRIFLGTELSKILTMLM